MLASLVLSSSHYTTFSLIDHISDLAVTSGPALVLQSSIFTCKLFTDVIQEAKRHERWTLGHVMYKHHPLFASLLIQIPI